MTQNITPAFLVATTVVYEPAVTVGSVNIAPQFITSTVEVFEPSVGQPTTPNGDPEPAYEIVKRNFDGSAPVTMDGMEADEIVWTLNEPTTAKAGWPKPSYSTSDIPTIATASTPKKFQIYHDGDLLFSGPMIQPAASGGDGRVDGDFADMLWLLNRRNIDAPRDNLVTNPSFESSFTGWTKVGTFTDTISSTRKILGTSSAKFVNTTDAGDEFYYQNFVAGPNAVGLLLTCVGWFYLEDIDAAALGSRGLYMEGIKDGQVVDNNYWAIDPATEVNTWVRAEFTLWIPPNEVWTLNLRVYAPNGTIYWDAIQVVAMESVGSTSITGSATSEADIAHITRLLVSFAQDSTYGKSQLHVGRNCPANGVALFRQYQFAEHISFGDAVGEFVDRDDGFDISIESTPTTETFTTHTPNKGTDRSATVTLQFPDGNIADYRFARDGAGAITRATILGEGDGPDREEGEYVDTSQLGGVVLQEVRAGMPDAQINSLLPTARDRVKKRRVPPLMLDVDIRPSAGLIHTLKVGDRVDVDIVDGYVNVQGTYRIVQLKLNCHNNVLTATINDEAD